MRRAIHIPESCKLWRHHPWLFWLLMVPAGGLIGALLVAYSGLFNIAASAGHPEWMDKFLALGMRRSIEVHSDQIKVPSLDEHLLPLGAAHFHGSCAICHGAPGQPVNPTFAQMLPQPPPLQEAAAHWRARELYWIGYHGLQFTGMPSWSGKNRQDEMWAVAALLRELPSMEVATYRRYASGNTRLEDPSVEQLVSRGMNIFPINTCDRCHGTNTAPAVSPHVPRLGGQSYEYLLRALQEYRADHRQSGFMEPVAVALEEAQLEPLARYYAALSEPQVKTSRGGDATAGRKVAEQGDAERLVPPCLSCHGASGRGEFPKLAGQHATYIEQQLSVWQAGGRDQTAYGAIMAQVARRLTKTQIADVAAYFASLSEPQGLIAPREPAP